MPNLAFPDEASAPRAVVEGNCGLPVDVQWLLGQVNELRSQTQACGPRQMPAVGPLRWAAVLQTSAQAYAQELAQGNVLSHIGPKGSTLRMRLRNSGYLPRSAGENLAAGQIDWEEVLDTWRLSPPHCENLMQPGFLEVGLACVVGPGSYERYWVMHLGRSVTEP